MTREEAIALLQPFRDCMVDQHGCPISDVVYALDVALDVLRKADRNGQERTKTDKHFVGDSKKVIDGLKMTMDLFLFNPSTGETLAPDDLNELNRITYDACKGAIELLSLQSEHATCYLDSPCEYQNSKIALPSAQPLRWIPCGKCIHADGKHRWCKVLDRTINEDYFCCWAEPWKEGGEW